MARLRPPDPHAVEEGDDRGRAASDAAERLAAPVLDRLRTGDAALSEMFHEAEEERQFGLVHALLVERQNVEPGLGMQKEIRILDALRDAFEG